MARRTDAFGQYTADEPTTKQGDYSWEAPQHPYAHQPLRGRQLMSFGGGGSAPARAGAAGVTTAHQRQKQAGEDSEADWHRSLQRADRLRAQYEGSRPWTGSPEDYNDVIAPDRSRVRTVTNGPSLSGLLKDQGWGEGTAGVRVPAKPNGNGNGNGLSGGAARLKDHLDWRND